MSFIEFDDVKKVYRTGELEIEALRGITFSIEKGEIVVILGESGAGKTTLLNILGGMDRLTSGSVRLDGQTIIRFFQQAADALPQTRCRLRFSVL